MKKFVFTAAMAATLAFGTTASASTELEGTAGTTPDQFLYNFDQLFEDLKLLFTFDSEEEATLLMEFAKERLAEAALMTEAEKTEYVSSAVADYTKLLETAKETVSEVIADEEASDAVKEELTNKLEEAAELDESVEGQLQEEELEEAQKIIDEAYLVANVVKGFDTETVKNLRTKEFGYGEITKIISLSELSGKTIEELTAMLEEKDIDEVMADLDVTMGQVKSIVLDKKIAYLENSLAEAGENENSKQVKKLEKKLSVLTAKKERFAARDEEKKDDGQESETPAESGEGTDGEQAADNGGTPASEEQTGSAPGTAGEETSGASEEGTASTENVQTLAAASTLSKKETAAGTSSVVKKEKPAKQSPDTVKKENGTGKAAGTAKKESAPAKNEKENVKAQTPAQTAKETAEQNKKENEPEQKEKAAEEAKKPADPGQKGKETSEKAKEEKTKDEETGSSDNGQQQQKPEKEVKEEKSQKENAKQKGGK
ncbi:hypothetical protein DRW41_06670 [Neobacillus piezotolerans]|uniref:DUF5667 domain-containing protein n=1 Tax=Neobacillus piezotolerans TaxID=2259171 RepID=A0A3D8GT72_9BACI|nr:DUF5667 domain-containing protein [Neobacillus piezotolerans]RDU37522.1 hypothetical protein DRW41_06670 [Neobacillus piezotolerans]